MATDPDVLQLANVLDVAGFGAVAGELLTEIALGREVEMRDDEAVRQGGEPAELQLRRTPYSEDEQFAAAIAFLNNRLVIPALAIGEAERFAGQLGDRDGKPVPIRLADAEGGGDDHYALGRAPGDDSLALKLSAVLGSLPDRREPPEGTAA